MLLKNNTFHLYSIKPDFKILYYRAPDILRQKTGLKAVLVTILIILPLLSGCGTAFIAAKQDDILTQIDVWSVENEYGKAFATLEYVKPSHPQYQKLQIRKKNLLTQAGEYEQRIDKQIQQLIKDNQWAQALDLLDQAKEKYPSSKGIEKTEKYFLGQQHQLLASIEQKIMLERSQWMIKARPFYQDKLNTDPRNEALKNQVENLNNEAKLLSEKLTHLSKEAINKKHYRTAKMRINQAIALKPSQQRQQILSQLQSREKKSDKKKQQTQSRTDKIQQDILIQEIEKNFKAGDFLKAKQLTLKLDENEQKNAQLIQLEQELERSIDDTIEQLLSAANKNYTNGDFYQAIELWEQVLLYEPQNALAKKNIRRAEEVIGKLIRLREKQ